MGQPNGYAVEVLNCGSLAAFLRSRASIERAASGSLKATVSFFLEPEWSRAEHMSNAGSPLLFVRDAPLDAQHLAPARVLHAPRGLALGKDVEGGFAPSAAAPQRRSAARAPPTERRAADRAPPAHPPSRPRLRPPRSTRTPRVVWTVSAIRGKRATLSNPAYVLDETPLLSELLRPGSKWSNLS